jgi:hypothetical protein
MLDVSDGLLEQLADVVVVQRVDDVASLAVTGDQAKMAQQPQLVRDRGRLHPDGGGELGHGARTGLQPAEDA